MMLIMLVSNRSLVKIYGSRPACSRYSEEPASQKQSRMCVVVPVSPVPTRPGETSDENVVRSPVRRSLLERPRRRICGTEHGRRWHLGTSVPLASLPGAERAVQHIFDGGMLGEGGATEGPTTPCSAVLPPETGAVPPWLHRLDAVVVKGLAPLQIRAGGRTLAARRGARCLV